ncbi:MAG: IS3 family transposase [Deltaproteobacteria bacterium]|nr:IS3 family transposase [Deltaproteobacteria bacterium]
MPRNRQPYPREFKAQIVALVRSGRSPEDLAREFEPSAQAIRNWAAQADRDDGRRGDGLNSAEREELRRLRKENRELRVEREILGKSRGLVRSGGRVHPPEAFEFVRANQADYRVATQCRVLGVSTSGYYAWRERGPSPRAQADQVLTRRIRTLHGSSRGTYGVPRVHAELRSEGTRVGRKRVARLMGAAELAGVSRRKGFKTTVRGRERHGIPDLVDRKFTASAPNQLWVADITYVPTASGFVFLAVVLDAFSRRIVGWSMAGHLRTSLVLDALDMALQMRRPDSVIHHSDQGCQYTSIAFGVRCREAGVRPSTGSVGDCYDNAMCESFFATLECELIDRQRFSSKAQARMAVFSFIEGWYNPRRRHSGLAYLSPAQYETEHHAAHA